MIYNYNVTYVLNSINLGVANKKLISKIIFTKKNLNLIKIFKNLNLIHRYVILKKNNIFYIKIYIYYFKQMRVAKNFKILSTPSKSFHISVRSLYLLSKRTGGSVFIISTSKGLITHFDAIKQKIGGILIGFCSL